MESDSEKWADLISMCCMNFTVKNLRVTQEKHYAFGRAT